MKNVLLPTDLTVQSLAPVHNIVRDAKNEKTTIHLLHLLSLPTSITDLLFIGENKPYNKVPGNFIDAYQLLRNKYKKLIEEIHFNFVYCNTSRYLNNYIEGNGIDKVYLLDNYRYTQPLQQSQNFIPLMGKCKVPVIKVSLHTGVHSEYQILSSLLGHNDNEPVTITNPAKPAMSYT